MEQFEHVFQCSYAEMLEHPQFELKGCWSEKFFGNSHPIVLELGCGKGEYAVELAKKNPEKNFIGVDIKGARMWTGAKAAVEENLTNVAFLRTGISFLDYFFATNEVDEIWITFPDPQMKKVNKRLTSTTFLAIYRSILSSQGIIHLKTDSLFLYTYTSELIKLNNLPVLAQTDDLYDSEIRNFELSIKTYYERQWLARGITIKYIAFKLPKETILEEPNIEIPFDEYRSFGRNQRAKLNI